MILRSVELENFGRFRGQTVEFRRGMNIVVGPNEAGKSTIAEAVPAVLFGTDRLERFKPWGRNACSATLFFEGQGRTIKIRRNLITDEVELVEKDDLYHVLSQFSDKVPLRGRSAVCREYRTLLESLLGVADEGLFRATYFFGHQPKEWSGDELAQKLRTLVTGTAETDYAEIIDGLLDDHFKLTRVNPWGRDKQRDREYEEVCQQLSETGETDSATSVPVFVEIDSSADIQEQINQISNELEDEHREHEKGLRYIERLRQQSQETSESIPATSVETASEVPKVQQAEGHLSDQLVAAGLPKNPPRELPEILSEAAEVRQEFAELQQPFSALSNREKKIPVVPWGALCTIVGLLAVVAAVAWWQDLQFFIVSIATGLCSALALGWGGWRHLLRGKASAACDEERSKLEQKKMLAQQRQADLTDRCEGLGLPTSAIDLVRLQKLVTTHRDLLEQWWGSGDSITPETCNPQGSSDTAKVDSAAVESKLTESAGDEQELRQLEMRMSEFELELRRKESRLQELKLQLEQTPAEQLEVSTVGGDLHGRKSELEKSIAVLRKAINLLASAVDEFSLSHLVRLNSEASKLLAKVTGGRYTAIKLNESMEPLVQVDERRWMPVDSFSRGTVDAIYLSLRVALAKVRDDGRSLPLMLDDPFVHLDHKRLTKTLNLVDLASADGQLILFSHNLELGKRAARERWHVVPLDGDAVAVSNDEGGENAGQLHLL